MPDAISLMCNALELHFPDPHIEHSPHFNSNNTFSFAVAENRTMVDVIMAKILLVEDDPIVTDELKLALENRDHTVVTAKNGIAGLRQFDSSRFDCVISDIIMPDMEGIGMMLEMRRRRPDTRIIMMSGGGMIGRDDFLYAAAKLGAVATVRKPIRPDELLLVLAECLATEIDGPGGSSTDAPR